jgi:uncharacterized RDD family membrane protein YckC
MNTVLRQTQCPNAKCRQIFVDNQETFCPECGTRLVPPASLSLESVPASVPMSVLPDIVVASKASRIAGYLIDVGISLLFIVFLAIPVIGQFIFGIAGAIFFLFRDINGASPGKILLGNEVIARNGSKASGKQKVLRNLLLALPDIAEIIPIGGLVLGPVAVLVIFGLETVVLVATGERLSDKIAGTMVVKRRR